MKNKERLFWLTLTLFLSFVTFYPSQKAKAISSEAEKYLQIFHEVATLIQTDFVEPFEEKKLYIGAIRGLLTSLGDPHSRFLDEDEFKQLQEETRGTFGGIGIEVTQTDGAIVVVAPIEDTPAMRAGIQPQDRIIEINGNPTEKMSISDAVKLMRGAVGTSLHLKIKRKSLKEPINITLNRELIRIKFIKSALIPEKKLGYLRLTQFMGKENTAQEYKRIIQDFQNSGIKGLIIDLRSNPGGLLDLAIDLSDIFLPAGKEIVSVRGRGGKLEKVYNASHSEFKVLDIPLVVLMNNGSASASEIFAGAMQDHGRAKIVGTQSFGKGSVQHIYPLSYKTGIALTIQKYYTPKGVSIHKVGITPDEVVQAIGSDEEEKPQIDKLLKQNLVQEFVKENPAGYTPENIQKCLEKFQGMDIKVKPTLAKYLLQREYQLTEKAPIYDLEFDPQLQRAIEILEASKGE
ncbi:MAG: S41 family peptidase [Leptospiraceae bacterium]|nr:S41 family peptidase [Leptospiraceae bacterium]